MTELYKFQKLRVYQMALDYVDTIYALSSKLPDTEKYNLRSQVERAATSIVLNPVRDTGHQLFIKLQAFRKSIRR